MRKILAVVLAAIPLLAQVQRKQGSPLDALPKNIEILTHFGERADISPDNQRIAFMNKSFGDAFVIDLKTRIIRCLTCNVPATAFLRVMHLSTGDFVLIGPEKFTGHSSEPPRRQRTVVSERQTWFEAGEAGAEDERRGGALEEEPEDRLLRDPRSESADSRRRVSHDRGRLRSLGSKAHSTRKSSTKARTAAARLSPRISTTTIQS